jgi:hypothetical protein
MGHVPSRELSAKPFQADLQTAKGHVDRLLAVALTRENFKDANDPLFQQFVALRCDPSVLHWFNVQNTENRTELPPAPSAEYLYKKHVAEVSDMIDKGVPPSEYFPIPIALFRQNMASKGQIQHPAIGGGAVAGATGPTMQDIIASGDEVQIVGYLGCRGPNHRVPVLSVFLAKSFWNEAKSISIFQIGCKCYEHFAALAGLSSPLWPTKLKARALDTNLPTLRLIQKICREYQDTIVPGQTAQVVHADNRVELTAPPETISGICDALSKTVASETYPGTSVHRRFRIRTQGTAVAVSETTPFDDIVEEAKTRWSESNALVVSKKKENAQQELSPRGSARGSVDSLSNSICHQPLLANTQSQGSQQIASTTTAVPGNEAWPPGAPQALRRPSSVRLPLYARVTLLVPTGAPNSMTAHPVIWGEPLLAFWKSPHQSPMGGLMIELQAPPPTIRFARFPGEALQENPTPQPCYVVLEPGAVAFVEL